MIALLAPLLLLAVPATGTWTVDDDGPADFAQIADAIAAVPAGDVLLVEPGTYAGFDLNKRLTILGRAGGPRPHVAGTARFSAPSGFTFAGFDVNRLLVEGVVGRGRIDDCSVAFTGQGVAFTMTVSACSQLVVSRTVVVGSEDYGYGINGSGLRVSGSRAMFVSCTFEGAEGYSAPGYSGGNGGMAVKVDGQSRVVFAGCMLTGGEAGAGGTFNPSDGKAGDGLVVDHSTVAVRGTPPQHVWSGVYYSFYGGSPGKSVIATASSTVVISGVLLKSDWSTSGGSVLLQPPSAEPYMTSVGEDAPDTEHDIRVYGAAGELALVAVSLGAGLAPLQGYDDFLWVDLSSPLFFMLPVMTLDQFLPVVIPIVMPAASAGLQGTVAELQMFSPGISSAINPQLKLAGNVAEIIVRF